MEVYLLLQQLLHHNFEFLLTIGLKVAHFCIEGVGDGICVARECRNFRLRHLSLIMRFHALLHLCRRHLQRMHNSHYYPTSIAIQTLSQQQRNGVNWISTGRDK